MSDSFSETTKVGFGSRIMDSFKGVLGGFAMVAAGIGLLWWNEGRTVNEYRSIHEIGTNVVESSTTLNTEHEGKLVHIAGNATTEDVLTDNITGASENGFFLIRNVEYYQ